RLWRSEKSDVARELVAHFTDGLAMGGTVESLIAAFGDPKVTARVVRRGKGRNRPWPWRLQRRVRQAVGLGGVAMVVLYVLLGARLWIARPTIRHDYLADVNAPALAVPEADRGWPLLRQAYLMFADEPDFMDSRRQWIQPYDIRPGDECWADAC